MFPNLYKLSPKFGSFSLGCVNYQPVRWAKRKPLWLPTAKSKVFRVPPRPVTVQDEHEEIKRLYNNYRTQIKSLRRYFVQKFGVQHSQRMDLELNQQIFEEDFRRCSSINDEWNAAQKVIRENRVAQELEKDLQTARERLEQHFEKQILKEEMVEEVVRKEKEASKNFISPEQLEAAIEHALNNPVDYNFALDADGNKVYNK